jgi:hypothetical protein
MLGHEGVMARTYQNLQHETDSYFTQYLANTQASAVSMMTPIYLICAIEVAIYAYLAAFGYLSNNGAMFKVSVIYTVIMGLTIWMYSIF